jgi:zinc transporter ZupT
LTDSSFKLLAVLFATGVTLHNLEEAIFLPAWSRSHLKLPFEPNRTAYWVVTSLVSVAIWIPVVGVWVSKENRSFREALSGFALAMAVNAVLPHGDQSG